MAIRYRLLKEGFRVGDCKSWRGNLQLKAELATLLVIEVAAKRFWRWHSHSAIAFAADVDKMRYFYCLPLITEMPL